MNYNEKFCFVKQLDETDCGAACIAIIAKYHGKSISVTKIRNLAGTDSQGTSARGILKAANLLNMSCKIMVSKEKAFKSDFNSPIICQIKRDGLEHYVVVLRAKRNMILVADPAEKISWVKVEVFKNWWSGVFFVMEPIRGFEDNKEDKSFLSRFFYLVTENKAIVAQSIVASFLLTVLGILGAFYFRFLIDNVIYSFLKTALVTLSLGYLAAIIFQNVLSYARNHLLMYLGNKLEASLLLNYFRHILKLPLDFFMKRKNGEILSRLSDIGSIKNALSGMTVGVILDCVMLLFGGTVLFLFSSRLVFIAMIPVVISGIMVVMFSRKFKSLIYSKAQMEAEKYSHFVESINGISTIKALSTEVDSYDKAELKIIDAIQRGFELANFSNIQSTIQTFLSQVGSLAVYWYGSVLIMNGNMSLGELISFVTLLGYFLGPLSRLITLQPQLQELSVSAKRLGEILDLKEENEDHKGNFPLSGNEKFNSISIKNLSFSYGTRGNTLENINLEIKMGEKVAFVGSSGSGKTTLMKLLLKFYTPDRGEILLDSKNIIDYDTKDYRGIFGYVPQEILLFSGTVYENISWGNYDSTPEEVFEAARKADALSFIEKLEDRFSTKVGEKGASLSGGERQRIALARVLLRRPKILILDEATSNLDSLSEDSIMRTIDNLPEGTTTIIVAHRLSSIKKCDRIFVLNEGKLVESGRHQELLDKNGFYASMWKRQNGME